MHAIHYRYATVFADEFWKPVREYWQDQARRLRLPSARP